jgi:hypothetical protein
MERLLAAQQEEIVRLRAAAAASAPPPLPQSPAAAADEPAPPAEHDAHPAERHAPSRRALLKLGGAAAAAGVAAMAAGASELAHPSAAQAHADTVTFQQTATGTTMSGPNIAIEGDGTSGALGVKGTSDGAQGVWGETDFGFGVYGHGARGTGVYGDSPTTFGVQGYSTSGTGARFFGGYAPLQLVPNTGTGVPSGVRPAGTFWVDSAGVLWYNQGSGFNTTWIRLTGPQSGVPGGAVSYLPVPIRIFDSRNGSPAPLPNPKSPLVGEAAYTIQVTGTAVGGLSVPAGASGVFGNLTVTNTQGPGDLILYPDGAARPNASNINYGPGQTVANAFNVGLSGAGAMDLFTHVSGTEAIIDIAGYVM